MKTTRKPDRIPAIHDQGVIKHDIPNHFLAPKHDVRFNGSMIRYEGKLLIAYRRYDPMHGRTTIAISELRDDFHPLKYYNCDLPEKCGLPIQEDCRLFIYNKELYISYTELNLAKWNDSRKRDIYQCHAKLEFDGVRYYTNASYRPQYSHNINGVEKNWTYFQHGKKLLAVYDIGKGIILELDPNGESAKEITSDTGERIYYPYGYLRGGTPPVKFDKVSYISFFHGSSTDAWLGRRYYMGAMLINVDSLKVTHVSKEPLVFGSKLEEFCGTGNGMCVFPMGSVFENNQWHVSCGINDTYNCILTFEQKQIMDSLVSTDTMKEEEISYFYTQGKTVTYDTLSGKSNKWKMIAMSGRVGATSILATSDPVAIENLKENNTVKEITKEEYNEYVNSLLPKDRTVNVDSSYAYSQDNLGSQLNTLR